MNKFSYSSLSLYQDCSYCWYLKYECGIKSKTISSNIIIGKIIHEYLEHEGDDNNIIDNIIVKNLPEEDLITGKSITGIINEVRKLVNLIDENPLAINIVEKELEIFMPFNVNGTDCVIHMFLDGWSDKSEVIEHKTSSIKYDLGVVHKSHQGRIYALGIQYLKGILPEKIIYDVLYKTKIGRREIIATNFDKYELQNTKDWMTHNIKGILNKEFTPSGRSKFPHKAWCEWHNLCPYCQ